MADNNKWLILNNETLDKIDIVSRVAREHKYYSMCKPAYFSFLKNEYNQLRRNFPELNFEVEARFKSFQSALDKKTEKMKNNESPLIYDFFGVKYIVKSVNGSTDPELLEKTCRNIMEFLSVPTPFIREIPGRRKDYVQSPKPNGYKSLHSCRVHRFQKSTFLSELQVLSEEMIVDTADHDLYKPPSVSKEGKNIPDIFEYIIDSDGFCKEVHSLSREKSFEKYFKIPFPADSYGHF